MNNNWSTSINRSLFSVFILSFYRPIIPHDNGTSTTLDYLLVNYRLYGSYQKIFYGLPSEGLEDLTGGIGEIFSLKGDTSPGLFDLITNMAERLSLIGLVIMVRC